MQILVAPGIKLLSGDGDEESLGRTMGISWWGRYQNIDFA